MLSKEKKAFFNQRKASHKIFENLLLKKKADPF